MLSENSRNELRPRAGFRFLKIHSWVPSWRRGGKDPDYRFTLANERTFLAWIRTALALLAGGVLLDQFASLLRPRWAMVTLAVSLATLAAALCLLAYLHWKGNEIAMRHEQELPSNMGIPLLGVTAMVVAVALTALILFGL